MSTGRSLTNQEMEGRAVMALMELLEPDDVGKITAAASPDGGSITIELETSVPREQHPRIIEAVRDEVFIASLKSPTVTLLVV